jgi:hypothetical protein
MLWEFILELDVINRTIWLWIQLSILHCKGCFIECKLCLIHLMIDLHPNFKWIKSFHFNLYHKHQSLWTFLHITKVSRTCSRLNQSIGFCKIWSKGLTYIVAHNECTCNKLTCRWAFHFVTCTCAMVNMYGRRLHFHNFHHTQLSQPLPESVPTMRALPYTKHILTKLFQHKLSSHILNIMYYWTQMGMHFIR